MKVCPQGCGNTAWYFRLKDEEDCHSLKVLARPPIINHSEHVLECPLWLALGVQQWAVKSRDSGPVGFRGTGRGRASLTREEESARGRAGRWGRVFQVEGTACPEAQRKESWYMRGTQAGGLCGRVRQKG